MHKSKLIELLKTLSEKEVAQFEDYIHSPIHNKDERCIQLWKAIKPYSPSFTSVHLDKNRLCAAVFPKENLTYVTFRGIVSKLTKLVEQFLIFIQMQNTTTETQRAIFLLHSLYERKQNKYFEQHQRKLEKKLTNSPNTLFSYYEKFQYYWHLSNFKHTFNYKQETVIYQSIAHNIRVYYIYNELLCWCSIISRAGYIRTDYNTKHLDALQSYILSNQLEDIPIIKCYYTLLLLLIAEQKEDYFQSLKQMLIASNLPLNKNHLLAPYTIVLNYCTQKIVNGHTAFYQEMFELYQAMLTQQLLLQQNYIPINVSKNIVTVGAKLKKFDWIAQFIEEYKMKVAPQYQESVYHFNKGVYHFYQQQYEAAFAHLIHVENINVFYYCDTKVLLLKSYFELEESEAFLSLADTLKTYLSREKSLSSSRKRAYQNFIKFSRRLYKIKALNSPKSLTQLLKDIQQADVISDRQWLLEKGEMIRTKRKGR